MSFNPGVFAAKSAFSLGDMLFDAALAGRARAQALADEAATDAALQSWYEAFAEQEAVIGAQQAAIVEYQSAIEVLGAELEIARAQRR